MIPVRLFRPFQLPQKLFRASTTRGRAFLFAGGAFACVTASRVALCQEDPHTTDGSAAAHSSPARSEDKKSRKDESDFFGESDPVKAFIEKYYSHVNELGISGVFGFCCGVTFKRVGRGVTVAIGVVFTGLQVLSHFGYIHINYDKISKDCTNIIDTNGDGKINKKDVLVAYEKVKEVLSSKLPSVSGFASGLALGLYLG